MAAEPLGVSLDVHWLGTDTVHHTDQLTGFDALWCVPASPYKNRDGALLAIRFARENGVPFLGTCGGFQHALVEYARNALGWADADHAETAPDAVRAVIAPLSCALVEAQGVLHLLAGTRIQQAYGESAITEGYHCRYGLNPAFRAGLLAGPLRASALDADGDIRAVELQGHPFFVATLFQPERAASIHRTPPLVGALLQAARPTQIANNP
jgi:CTP synthase (UTP-ammonia lyase)